MAHGHPFIALSFLIADLFVFPSLGTIGDIVGIIAGIIVSFYYIISLWQKHQEHKLGSKQTTFQQITDIADARADEIHLLREDIARLQQEIEKLTFQLQARAKENESMSHELQSLRLVYSNIPEKSQKHFL